MNESSRGGGVEIFSRFRFILEEDLESLEKVSCTFRGV